MRAQKKSQPNALQGGRLAVRCSVRYLRVRGRLVVTRRKQVRYV